MCGTVFLGFSDLGKEETAFSAPILCAGSEFVKRKGCIEI
jgi:hypothetical protein